MVAVETQLDVPAQRGGPAAFDGVQDLMLVRGKHVLAPERLAVASDNVRHLVHGPHRRLERVRARAGCRHQCAYRSAERAALRRAEQLQRATQ